MRLYSLIVDAGPLIALFSAQDRDHALCRSGFEQLAAQQISIRIPLPVLFEVYKWLLHHATYNQAQIALLTMQESLEVDPLNLADLSELTLMVQSLTNWKGSLEDASVILMAQRHQCPIWTLNYRDLGIFKGIEFWNPL